MRAGARLCPSSRCLSDIQLPLWRKHLKRELGSNCDAPGQDVADRGGGVILLFPARKKIEDSYLDLHLILEMKKKHRSLARGKGMLRPDLRAPSRDGEMEMHSRRPLVKAGRSRPHTPTSYLRMKLGKIKTLESTRRVRSA